MAISTSKKRAARSESGIVTTDPLLLSIMALPDFHATEFVMFFEKLMEYASIATLSRVITLLIPLPRDYVNWAAEGMKIPFRSAKLGSQTTQRIVDACPRPTNMVSDTATPAGDADRSTAVDGPVWAYKGPIPKKKPEFRKASTLFLKWGLGQWLFFNVLSLLTLRRHSKLWDSGLEVTTGAKLPLQDF